MMQNLGLSRCGAVLRLVSRPSACTWACPRHATVAFFPALGSTHKCTAPLSSRMVSQNVTTARRVLHCLHPLTLSARRPQQLKPTAGGGSGNGRAGNKGCAKVTHTHRTVKAPPVAPLNNPAQAPRIGSREVSMTAGMSVGCRWQAQALQGIGLVAGELQVASTDPAGPGVSLALHPPEQKMCEWAQEHMEHKNTCSWDQEFLTSLGLGMRSAFVGLHT
eukprot:1160058-Pelagomonas_calceolata.AAC.2